MVENVVKKENKPEKKKVSKKEEFNLSAVFISGDKHIAVLQDSRKKQQRVMLGEEYNGWTLTKVDSRQVTLESGGQIKELELNILPSSKRNLAQNRPTKKSENQSQMVKKDSKNTKELELAEKELNNTLKTLPAERAGEKK